MLPAALAEEVAHDALEQESREALALERVKAGESVRGVYPLSDERAAEYEALAATDEPRSTPHEHPFAADPSAVRGAITPLITPFTDDGALDLETIPRLVDWQLEHGSHGISVGGSTGEPTSQTVAERIAVMRAAAARDRRPRARSCPAPAPR